MRKIELVFLHELLTLVREEYEQELGHVIDCDAYDQLRTHPQAIPQQKATHSEAIQTLADDLTTDVTEHPPTGNGHRYRSARLAARQRDAPSNQSA